MTAEPITNHEVRIELFDYAWNHVAEFDQFTPGSFKLSEIDVGVFNLTFTVPFETGALAASVTKDAVTQTVYQWGPPGEFHVMAWIRGNQEFEGDLVVMDDDEKEAGAASDPGKTIIDVKIECWGDAQAYLARRQVKGTNGDRYALTSVKADTAIADLINSNCKTGSVIEPTAYATLGTGGVDRENFGGVLVGATAAGTHPTTITRVRWDNSEDLWTAVMEECKRYQCRLRTSWDKTASPPVLTITVVYYGDEAVDRTATVVFSRENGGLRSCPRTVELMRESNVAEVGGKGTRVNQSHGYAIHQASYDAVGLMETGDTWPGGDATDATEEAEFIIAQVGGSSTVYKPRLQETDGLAWQTNFTFDKVTIDDSRRGITIQDYLTGVEFTLQGPQNLRLVFTLGRDEPSNDQKQQRSGGGGSGGKRSGGKPKSKNGEPSGARTIAGNTGVMTFDEAEDDSEIKGETLDRLRAHVLMSDPGAAEGGVERSLVYLEGESHAQPLVQNDYIWCWDPVKGYDVKVLVRDDGPGHGTVPAIGAP